MFPRTYDTSVRAVERRLKPIKRGKHALTADHGAARHAKVRELWAIPACVVLGLGRVVTVKAANYNEHASE